LNRSKPALALLTVVSPIFHLVLNRKFWVIIGIPERTGETGEKSDRFKMAHPHESRRRCLMGNIFVVLLTIIFLENSAQAADRLRIGFPNLIASYLSLPLGQKRGFLQEEGLQAEFIRMNPTVGLATLISGEIDYYTSIGPGVAAAIRGVPAKIVACYVPGPTATLIARPEFKSVQDLRGKTIGINGFGDNLEIVGRMIFKHFGLDPDKDIKFLATGPTESRLAVMKQGLIAAALGGPPADFLGKKMGFVVLIRAHELFSFPVTGVLASDKRIKERPDEIKRVIKAGIKANRYIRQNRDGTIQAMVEWLKVDKEMATATYDSVRKAFNEDGNLPEDGLRLLIEEAKKAGKVSREIVSSDVADLTILREAQQELGIKAK
jgi:ABC-type nitrate/sulfonate/bicarbonate transport system substrate-binding protein